MSTTMTVEATPSHPTAARTARLSQPGAGPVTLSRTVRSEWVKFKTLRSGWLVLAGAFLSMVGLAAAIGYNTGKNWSGLALEDSVPSGVLQGYHLAIMVIAVLGVLFVTGEYGTGSIRSTLAAVPRRWPVLAAKTSLIGGLGLVSMVAASFAAFATGQLFLAHYGHGTSITDPGVLRVVIGTGAYLALIAVFGAAVGWIVRNTAGGITVALGVLLVLPLIVGFLPGSLGTTITRYLPSTAGESFITSVRMPDTLAPWAGLAVLVAWVAAALVLAFVQLRRRDA